MMKAVNYFCLFLLVGLASCKETNRLDIEKTDGAAPTRVLDVQSISIPGGAKLVYRIPNDPNIAYVKAIYELHDGSKHETKSSIYTDTLTVLGYGDIQPRKVQLYSVGKNEKESDPVEVTVTPLTPPVTISFTDLVVEEAFGGIRVRLKNELQANLAVVLMADTSGDGTMTSLQTFYTKAKTGVFSYRGLAPTEKQFAIYLRDRWGNRSDTLSATLTPLYEESIVKPYVAMKLATDEYIGVEAQYGIDNLWDNNINSIFASRHSTATPQWFAIDLGVKAVISRMKMHQRAPTYTYTGGNVKSFELWGSNSPDPDGGWNNWQLLSTFNSFKPSGQPSGQISQEDVQYAHIDGEDFEMEDITPAYRYLRIKTTGTYGGGPQVTISEISFWGQIQEN